MGKIFLLFVVIIILAVGVVYVTFIKDKETQIEFSFKGVTLSVNDYNSIKEEFKDYPYVRICNIENGDCVLLTKLQND